MAARTSTRARATDDGMAAFDVAGKNVHKTALADELKTSFLEYAYSVIHSRALPDARDGLKPVHRRILFHMADAGITPDKGHVKSARVVGDVMGRYHPHGDSAIYDALVRMAQPFSLNVPLIDPHGNFGGEPGDSAAAYRYTECRLAHPALSLTDELGEDTVDWVPNYDESLKQPSVLPAAFPNLLVNGSDGIAVGMATNMPPHNLGEVCDAARHLVLNPDATLARLRKFIPGPDLPTGGQIIGADEIDKAYKTGRGVFRIRATVDVGPLPNSRGRNAITITELPYSVGPEKVIEKIKAEMGKNRLSGIADVKNLSDRNNKLRLVIECKTGVNPQALLADLWKYTQLQESFGVNNLALIGGEPRTLGLRELLEAWVNHRLEVVRRRTRHRLQKAKDRLHNVEGLLIALDNIDRVVKLIRASKTTDEAKTALIKAFKLSDVQATYILDMPLRRLTALEADKLRAEASELRERITALQTLLDDEAELRKVIAGELAEVKKRYATPRRTVLVDGDLAEVLAETAAQAAAVPKEIADDPVTVWLSTTGLLGRSAAKTEVVNGPASTRSRAHSAVAGESLSTARGAVLVITNRGRAVKVDVLDLPVIPPGPKGEGPSLRAGAAAVDVAALAPGEHAVGIVPFGKAAEGGVGVAMGTRMGVVKVSQTDWPVRGDQWDVIGLKDGDEVVSATWLASPDADLVFVTSDAQLLRFDAAKVRPQGRLAGGMAGINLGAGASVLAFAVVPRSSAEMLWQSLVVTSTAKSTKVTPLDEYPSKGRATGGVRCQRFVKGEDALVAAWVGQQPAATDGAGGEPLRLPGVDMRRDGSGAPAVPPTTLGGTGRHPGM